MKKFYQSMDAVYDSNLSGHAKSVLIYLYRRSNHDGKCWPSLSTIANAIGFSLSTVRRAIEEAISAGFLDKENRKREGTDENTSNIYTVDLPEFQHESVVLEDIPISHQNTPSQQTYVPAEQQRMSSSFSKINQVKKSRAHNKSNWSEKKQRIQERLFGLDKKDKNMQPCGVNDVAIALPF